VEFLIATSNAGKVREISKIFAPLDIKVKPVYEIDKNFSIPKETGKTFEENAELKAESVYKLTKMATIADDSGLEVSALDGAPGIYSARYAGENASDQENIEKLLHDLKGISRLRRGAKFVCAICCILPNGEKIFSKGECYGFISERVVGKGGFGYDPVFLTPSGESFAEISEQEKNTISHRGSALRKLYKKLENIYLW
jgi:non-canonical purine NTP pyrophosphatase, rdgB/HAM1 family